MLLGVFRPLVPDATQRQLQSFAIADKFISVGPAAESSRRLFSWDRDSRVKVFVLRSLLQIFYRNQAGLLAAWVQA